MAFAATTTTTNLRQNIDCDEDGNLRVGVEDHSERGDGSDDDSEPSRAKMYSFGLVYELYVPWDKYLWFHTGFMDGQILTNEAISKFFNENVYDCQGSSYENVPCSWKDIFQKGPCRRVTRFYYRCVRCSYSNCKDVPDHLFDLVENDLKTKYPWSDWLTLEWVEQPTIIPNPKELESANVDSSYEKDE